MSRDFFDNNRVNVKGEILSSLVYVWEKFGEKFYTADVGIFRQSGIIDVIPVMISDRMINVKESIVGSFVEIEGQFRSFNLHKENKNRLILSVFVKSISKICGEDDEMNQIKLDGFLCKPPIYRKTPKGREVADIILAVNRNYGKSDYIPCVVWGRNARYISKFPIGTEVKLEGRIQSREYSKKLDDGTQETRTAYEVSVSRIYVAESEENEDGSRSEENL